MTTQPKKQTPTQTIRTWIKDFVTKPNPIFGNLPPCPFAQKAIVDGKVEFLELDGIGEFGTIYSHIWNFDFDDKEVLVIIAEPDQFTAKETVEMASRLNTYYMPRDVVILEDHPKIPERVKTVKLNNGRYILFLAQRLSKLNRYSEMLEKGPYYRNWSRSYLRSVKGFRRPAKTRS
jgi:hypothetical protein